MCFYTLSSPFFPCQPPHHPISTNCFPSRKEQSLKLHPFPPSQIPNYKASAGRTNTIINLLTVSSQFLNHQHGIKPQRRTNKSETEEEANTDRKSSNGDRELECEEGEE